MTQYNNANIDILSNMWKDGLIDEETALKQIQKIITDGLFNSPNTSVSINNLSINNESIKNGGAIIKKPSLKSKKKRKSKKKECEATPKPITAVNIDKYIETYLKENLKIDFRKVTTTLGDTRWALTLFIKDKPFSRSTLCLNI